MRPLRCNLARILPGAGYRGFAARRADPDAPGASTGLSLRSAAIVCGSRFRCACTSSGGVSLIHWFSDRSWKRGLRIT